MTKFFNKWLRKIHRYLYLLPYIVKWQRKQRRRSIAN